MRAGAENGTLQFTIHWNGGTHTQLEMERPRSATETTTPMEALEIIRRMAARHGDNQIASVLNRLGYSTGKGNGGIRTVWPPPGATIRFRVKSELYLILIESA